MKPQFICCFVLVLCCGFCPADETEKLEARLAQSRDADRIEVLATLADANKNRAPEKAIAFGKEALNLLSRFPDRAREIGILDDLSMACIAMGELGTALEYNNRSLLLAKQDMDDAGIVTVYNIRGRIHRHLDEYDKALAATLQGLEISREIDDRKQEAVMLNAAGIIYRRLGDYNKALDYFVQSLEIETELDDKSGIARMKHNIGIIYKKLGNYSQALKNYQQALDIKKEIGLKKDVDNTLNNIGNVYEEQGDFEAALEYHIQALDIREKAGAKSKICTSNINIAVVYDELGEFEKALVHAGSALQISRNLEHKSLVAWLYQILASVFRKMGKLPEALEHARESHRISGEIDSRELVKEALLELSEVYAAMGDFEKALEHFKRYKSTDNSIFGGDLREKIAMFQTVFEKEQELALLKVENEKKSLLLQKEVLLRNASLAVVALTLVFGAVAIGLYRLKKKAHEKLAAAHGELEKAMSEIKALSGLLPICANCKKVRDDEGYWQQIEAYISMHSDARFSHGICPNCVSKLYPMHADIIAN
jgi:tetratricopeptide (TPR) repeat protein